MALLDTAHRNLYIACTGDCRAVAGIWEENSDGQGSWRVEVLSEDQTGRNPNELERFDLSFSLSVPILLIYPSPQNAIRAPCRRVRFRHSKWARSRRSRAYSRFWRCTLQMAKYGTRYVRTSLLLSSVHTMTDGAHKSKTGISRWK